MTLAMQIRYAPSCGVPIYDASIVNYDRSTFIVQATGHSGRTTHTRLFVIFLDRRDQTFGHVGESQKQLFAPLPLLINKETFFFSCY